VLLEAQRRATHVLFHKLRLDWIPPDYFRLLRAFPDPVEAFEQLALQFGLKLPLLRQRDLTETAILHQCLGILLELGELDKLSDAYKERVRDELRSREYDTAEALVDTARTVAAIMNQAVSLGSNIIFPAYVTFLNELVSFVADPSDLTADDAAEARQAMNGFTDMQQRFDAVIAGLEAELAWMAGNWPDDDWGREHELLRDGFILIKEETEAELRGSTEADVAAGLTSLDEVLQDLLGFIEEIRANHKGAGYSSPTDSKAAERWQEWRSSATLFGFKEDEEPAAGEIKKWYRMLAMSWHPDRHMDKSTAVRRQYEEKFKQLGLAREILDRGKPPKP